MRLHAEQAITLLAQARAAAKLENQEALDAMELGARRIDFIGLKFEAAAGLRDALCEGAGCWRATRAAGTRCRRLLYTIGSNNGRLEDIRDGYSQLGQLYHDAWLRDNRPYWLANNMARYDRAAQLWVGRGNAWNNVIEHWWSTHTLPASRGSRLAGIDGELKDQFEVG